MGSGLVSRLAGTATLSVCLAALGGCGGETQGMGGDPTRGDPQGGPPPVSAAQLAAVQGPSVDEIVTRLGLTADQEPAARSVLDAAADERSEILPDLRKPLRSDPGIAEAGDVLERLADLDLRTASMLESILTAEQLAAFRSLMARAQEERGDALSELVKSGRPPGGRPAGGPPQGGFGGGGFPRG